MDKLLENTRLSISSRYNREIAQDTKVFLLNLLKYIYYKVTCILVFKKKFLHSVKKLTMYEALVFCYF